MLKRLHDFRVKWQLWPYQWRVSMETIKHKQSQSDFFVNFLNKPL